MKSKKRKLELFDSEEKKLFINEVRNALSIANTRQEKITLLTTLPSNWSIRTIQKTFDVSRRIVSTSKKLKKDCGYGSQPQRQRGRMFSTHILQ